MIRLSSSAANEIISLWLDDGKLFDLSQRTRDELNGIYIYFPKGVRTFLAELSPIASDYLWDDDLIAAQQHLVVSGICKKVQRRPKLPRGNARRGALVCSIQAGRLSGQHSAPQHDWHYVK